MQTKIKILIADDHQMFIDGVKALLQSINNIEIIGEANTGLQVLERISSKVPDVILMDIGMPGLNGIDTANQLKELYPEIKIIMLTMYDDSNTILKIIDAGVKGHVLKNTNKQELLTAIETVSRGGSYFSPEVSLNAIKDLRQKNNDPIDSITDREMEIIRLIVGSFTNKEIADKLYISELTVNTHRKNAMRKLGIKNTAGLVKFAIENKIAG